jgi:hypothetical protein
MRIDISLLGRRHFASESTFLLTGTSALQPKTKRLSRVHPRISLIPEAFHLRTLAHHVTLLIRPSRLPNLSPFQVLGIATARPASRFARPSPVVKSASFHKRSSVPSHLGHRLPHTNIQNTITRFLLSVTFV